MTEVVITGLGLVLPNCADRRTFWRQLRDGDSQLSLGPDPARPGDLAPMGLLGDFDPREHLRDIPERYYRKCSRAQLIYLASLLRARDDAGLEAASLRSDRVGLFDGTSRDNFD